MHKYKCQNNKWVHANVLTTWTNEELARLGVATIGDMVLLKEKIREVRNLNVYSLRI